MKLTQETASKINVGDYIRIDYGKDVTIEGAVYASNLTKGLWIDCPDGSQRVQGPSVFQKSLDVTWPRKHPKMARDSHTNHFKAVKNET